MTLFLLWALGSKIVVSPQLSYDTDTPVSVMPLVIFLPSHLLTSTFLNLLPLFLPVLFPLTDPKLCLLLNARHKLNLTVATPIRHRPRPLPITRHNRIRPAHTISSQLTTRKPRRQQVRVWCVLRIGGMVMVRCEEVEVYGAGESEVCGYDAQEKFYVCPYGYDAVHPREICGLDAE
jgi:hypothetical protein